MYDECVLLVEHILHHEAVFSTSDAKGKEVACSRQLPKVSIGEFYSLKPIRVLLQTSLLLNEENVFIFVFIKNDVDVTIDLEDTFEDLEHKLGRQIRHQS